MNKIEEILRKELANPDTVFVFATSVVSSSWVQWCVKNTDYKAVALERFLAWDKFKTSCICESAENELAQIPSILRKLYARYVVQNKAFKKIISSKYTESASSFAPWLANVLPSLNSWKKQYDEYHQKNPSYKDDEEDCDYLDLYNDYKNFLEKNKLYETSWIEPNFKSTGKKYIIFYPEILDDFADYEKILSEEDSIELITLKNQNQTDLESPNVLFYTNSRTELKQTVLKIRALHFEQNIPWSEIALDVPDLETCRPYVERELALYCIPYNVRAGLPLCKNSAGHIFSEIRDCVQNDFSYDSMRSLLLDGYLPWKNPQANNALVRQGSLAKCLINFENRDLWIESLPELLTSSVDNDDKASGHKILDNYKEIKSLIQKISSANSFSKLRESWFAFRDTLLDVEKFSSSANKILGRCVSELDELVEIEKNFLLDGKCGISVDSPFSFYLSELEKTSYQPQSRLDGISVFPYKLSAASAIPYHFVINANQKSISIEYSSLSFLSQKKRDLYALGESLSVAWAFINLYNLPFESGQTIFSASESSFSGFAIANSLLKKIDVQKKSKQELEEKLQTAIAQNNSEQIQTLQLQLDEFKISDSDFIKKEKDALLYKQNASFVCTDLQKNSFTAWSEATPHDKKSLAEPNYVWPEIKNVIHNYLFESIGGRTEPKTPNALHISTSAMDSFFTSPRLFFFTRILNLKEDSLDTDLLDVFDRGKINHMLLHLFFKNYKQIPSLTADGLLENEIEIKEYLTTNIFDAFNESESYNKNKNNSVLVQEIFNSQKDLFISDIIDFLRRFAKDFALWNVYSTEESFNEAISGKDFMYNGKVDCILSNNDATELALVDFKNSEGSIPSKDEMFANEDGELSNFQMPMYLKLWSLRESRLGHSKTEIDKARFYAIKKSNSGVRAFLRTEDEMKKNEDFGEYKKSISNTVQAMDEHAEIFDSCIKQLVLDSKPLPILLEEKKLGILRVCRIVYNGTGLGLSFEETEEE